MWDGREIVEPFRWRWRWDGKGVVEIIRGWRDELQEGSDVEALECEAEGLTVLRDEVRVERFCRSARLGDLVQDRGGSWTPRAERFDYHRNETKTVGSTLLEVPGELDFLLIFCSCDSGTNTRTG